MKNKMEKLIGTLLDAIEKENITIGEAKEVPFLLIGEINERIKNNSIFGNANSTERFMNPKKMPHRSSDGKTYIEDIHYYDDEASEIHIQINLDGKNCENFMQRKIFRKLRSYFDTKPIF